MTTLTLKELREAREAATQGKWEIDGFHMSSIIVQAGYDGEWDRVLDTGSGPKWREDALFCRIAANHWLPLLDRLERAEKALAEIAAGEGEPCAIRDGGGGVVDALPRMLTANELRDIARAALPEPTT